jgi:hypothetical protein
LREGGAWEQWPNRHNETTAVVVNHAIDLPHHKEEKDDGVDVIYFTEA